MKHYEFTQQFKTLYDKAVGLYAKGQRGADTYFSESEKAWLAANGLNSQHLYDYAEDHNNYGGEPGFDNALGIELIRRDYFLNAQNGKASKTVLDESKLPPKDEAVQGISWLPRIIPKTKAKLHGELPPSLMYCCGGDRKFFKQHDILPAEFINVVWRNEANDSAIISWVAARSKAAQG